MITFDITKIYFLKKGYYDWNQKKYSKIGAYGYFLHPFSIPLIILDFKSS